MQAPPTSLPYLSPGMPSNSFFETSPPTTSTTRPTTRDGSSIPPPLSGSHSPNVLTKERKSSFSRKSSISSSRRRGSTSTTNPSNTIVTDATAPPALPEYALAAAAKIIPRDAVRSPISPESISTSVSRNTTSTYLPATPATLGPSPTTWQPNEATAIYQQIVDVANKRMSTLEYLRKAHEGQVYWFNTFFLDKNDLARMPAYDPRKLARKATNLLLLGLSIPTINDLYSSTPLEFLRCFNALLSEFDSFQQLHGESSNSLTRARLPNMFRRPGGKTRRSTSVADGMYDDGTAGGASFGGGATSAPSVMNFATSESDLLPGEEYTYLLTPSLPFDPDFFETFATLCDVLIDCYKRFLSLVSTPRDCSAPVAELFSKADSKVKKLIVQGVVKEFEEQSKAHVKVEVASIGKVVLSGLM